MISTRFDIAGKVPEGLVNRRWVQKNVMHLTDEEIDHIATGRIEDKLLDADVEIAASEESTGGEDVPPADDSDGLFSADENIGNLLVGSENFIDEDEEPMSIDDDEAPIKVDKQINNIFGETIRKRKNRLGPGYLQMPDFKSITGIGSTTRSRDTSNKPFETVENDFADLLNDSIGFSTAKPRMSTDVTNALSSLDNVISNKVRIISETPSLADALNIDTTDEEDQNGTPQ